MGGNAGDVFQSIVQVTDSLGLSRIDLPVSAVTTSRSGLWVGAAVVTTVDQIAAEADPQDDGTALVHVRTDADAGTPAEFPIRLIFHRNDAGQIKLLQRVFVGENTSGAAIVGTAESFLDAAKLASARRLSSASFPVGGRFAKTAGDFGIGTTAGFIVALPASDATNPFVHAFHPDHKASAAPEITRAISLAFDASAPADTSPLGWGSTVLTGTYSETLTGLRAQAINIKGAFVLRRISNIGTLTE